LWVFNNAIYAGQTVFFKLNGHQAHQRAG
jgi:hypothetical protein